MKKRILICLLVMLLFSATMAGCGKDDAGKALEVGKEFSVSQPIPTDISYSLERYNLIRRAYWVNGEREKAISLPCKITKPLGYVILITNSGSILGRFVVDGKVTCLNTYLVPETTHGGTDYTEWLPDVDGCFGSNVDGIFFFTTDGKYIEWNGAYLYSDIPFSIEDPVLGIK